MEPSCAFYGTLRVAALKLESARDVDEILERADELQDLAALFCGNATALMGEAAEDEFVSPLFQRAVARRIGADAVIRGRDRLLEILRTGCLRCNDVSPFDPLAA